jgi:glycine C-acetyltransferase
MIVDSVGTDKVTSTNYADLNSLSADERERLLTQSMAHYRNPSGSDLIARSERFSQYIKARLAFGLWPYSRALEKATGPETTISDAASITRTGINFASQDYLGLSRDPRITDVAMDALRQFGPHSAGSAVLLGNTRLSYDLEAAIGDFLQMDHVVLYPTGWAAGYGAIAAFVRPRDYVILDYLSHACLQQGAAAATRQIEHFAHNDPDNLRDKLVEIREKDSRNGILVVTEGLFSMDSDTPNIAPIQNLVSEYGGTLLVDVAHDLGALGPGGTGALGAQKLLGKVDLVMGSFSKTFSSNGGFLACHTSAVKQFAKYFGNPHMFSNALSPVQAAIVTEAIRIVRSPEGDILRERLLTAVNALRDAFAEHGITCLGSPSAIVPVPFENDQLARLSWRNITDNNLFVNLVEYPAVAVGSARLRMQVMATHTSHQVREAVGRIIRSRDEAKAELARWQEGSLKQAETAR